jgi:predicted anti-sigma-YlaC factor YlaD
MMHRIIRDHLEQVLGERSPAPDHPAGKHLAECGECRDTVAAMREQAAMLRQWRAPELEPRPGFYARVLDRIEAQTPASVFTLFFDSLFGRRIAMAALALALLLGVYVISSEQMAEPQMAAVDGLPQATLVSDHVSDMPQDFPVFSDDRQPRLITGTPDQDAVLVNLVTYREQ